MKPTSFYDRREWKELRYRVLRKNGAKCTLCGSTKAPIHVDHIKPIFTYPELALTENNLQVLCELCNLGKRHHFADDWRKPKSSDRDAYWQKVAEEQKAKMLQEMTPEMREFIDGIRASIGLPKAPT